MTSTLETPGAYDVLGRVAPDEPIFPLRAHDPCAPATITEWCRLTRNRAFSLYGGSPRATDKELLAAKLQQCADAEDVAIAMDEWRKREAPEAATEVRSSYQEVVKSAEELAEADKRKRKGAALQHLREAAYHLCEAKDIFVGLELIGERTAHDLVLMLARINGLADEHEPKRSGVAAQPGLPLAEGAA